MERNLELENKILEIVKSHPNGTWPRIILAKENKHLLDYINARTPKLQNGHYKLSTKIYWTLNDIQDFPLCQNEHCHKPLIGMNAGVLQGYVRPFCNMKCSRGSAKAIEKDKQTRLKRYGNENYRNREKAKQTYIEHYGVDHNMKSAKGKAEYNAAIQEKYGANWMTQTKHFQDKAKETWTEKYGVDNPTKSKEIVEEMQERFLEKHGVKNPMQLEEVQEKVKQTCLDKYGVECTFQSPLVIDKCSQTFLKRYGIKFALCNGEIRYKRDKTCIERYGTKNPTQNLEVKEKLKKSLKQWYANNTRPFKILYKYDGRKFDSSWELYYYIWLKDNDVEFEFQPKKILPFSFNGEEHFYHPDFLVEGKLVEIKGDQFFKEDGTMCCPWRYPKWTDAEKEMVDALYEAKRQCMEKNGVKILRGSDLEEMFQYIEAKYGYDFIEKFKIEKNK